jgi:hypothetical protein
VHRLCLTDTWRIARRSGARRATADRDCAEPVDGNADTFCNDPYWVVIERITLRRPPRPAPGATTMQPVRPQVFPPCGVRLRGAAEPAR